MTTYPSQPESLEIYDVTLDPKRARAAVELYYSQVIARPVALEQAIELLREQDSHVVAAYMPLSDGGRTLVGMAAYTVGDTNRPMGRAASGEPAEEWLAFAGQTVILENVAVDRLHRSTSFGRQIVEYVTRAAQALRMRYIEAYDTAGEPEFYRRLGFVVLQGNGENYYVRDLQENPITPPAQEPSVPDQDG